jgi:quercetin dioxygenase-like cupin family protein
MLGLTRIVVAAMVVGSGLAGMAALAQTQNSAGTNTPNEVRCIDIPAGKPRPAQGCFNLAHVSGLKLARRSAVWRLYRFSSESAAHAALAKHGVVVGEDGAYWLSEVTAAGTKAAPHAGGTLAAEVGPLNLPPAKDYTATLAYAVMSPGQRSRTHTHPGPEAFYVISGEQCVETPAGVKRAKAGEGFSEPAGVPMELRAIGAEERRGFALVLHDSAQAQAAPVSWHASGACGS